MLPYREGVGLPVVGGGGSLKTHNSGSVTTQMKAVKHMMASEPYRYKWYLKQVMASLPYIKIYFFKNTYSIENKVFEFGLNFPWKFLGRYAKTGFFTK